MAPSPTPTSSASTSSGSAVGAVNKISPPSSSLITNGSETSCKYIHRTCMQDCLDGYSYCVRHILEDKTAPYKQCAYMTKAGRRCAQAAPKLEKKESYCVFHNRKSLLARQRLSRKRRPGETGETLLEELVNFTSAGAGGGGSQSGSHIEQHHHRRGKMYNDSVASRALEYASSSDSDSELGPLVEQTWREDGDSDAESIDSDQEDLLKYAGVYTTEEVAQILRDKLIRLQALYIDQFKRLKHVLLNKRRQYLKTCATERESFGSIKLYKTTPSQKGRYSKLRALQQYHRKSGKEAILQRQSNQRRMQAAPAANSSPLSPNLLPGGLAQSQAAAGSDSLPSCTFIDDGVACRAKVVPFSKFCQKHILHDPWQLLYKPCPFADSQCGRPVPILFNTEFCSLHQLLPSTVKAECHKKATDVEADSAPPEDNKDAVSMTSDVDGGEKPVYDAEVKLEVKPEIKPDPDTSNLDDDHTSVLADQPPASTTQEAGVPLSSTIDVPADEVPNLLNVSSSSTAAGDVAATTLDQDERNEANMADSEGCAVGLGGCAGLEAAGVNNNSEDVDDVVMLNVEHDEEEEEGSDKQGR